MRFGVLISRVRRYGFQAILNPFPDSRKSLVRQKHVKINDDEERLPLTESSASYHLISRSPNVQMLKIMLSLFLTLLFLVFVLSYTIYKPPKFVISYLQNRYPDVLFEVHVNSLTNPVVALTIDDAPSPETSKILDILKFHGATATFFIIGNQIAGYEHILQRINQEGHELGNHAWADEPSSKLPLAELTRQIKEVESLMPPNSNRKKYFRPGSGFFNRAMVKVVGELGYQTVLGGIYPHDPQIHSSTINARHVLSMVRPGGIIIMHDRRSYSAEQIGLVLSGLAKGKWKVGSVGRLLEAGKEP